MNQLHQTSAAWSNTLAEREAPSIGPKSNSGISVCIVCRNEADKLGPCLDSVSWVDEVILMDLSSSDDSAHVARQHGATVIEREAVPIVEMVRNEVAARATHDWILALDPDERVTPGLAEQLRSVASLCDIDAVIIPRMNMDLGYPPSHARQRYEPQLRMYRRSRVDWPVIPNALPRVPEDRLFRIPPRDEFVMVHDRNRNIPEALDRAYRYAAIEGRSMVDRGQVFSAQSMAKYMASTLYTQFIVSQAWRDGLPGLLRAGILVGFKFYVWAAFWQASGARRTSADDRFVRRVGFAMETVRYTVKTLRIVLRATRRLRQMLQPRGAGGVRT